MNTFFVWLDGLTPLAFVLLLVGFWALVCAALHWLWRDVTQAERDSNEMVKRAAGHDPLYGLTQERARWSR
jgi:hypothetical protein